MSSGTNRLLGVGSPSGRCWVLADVRLFAVLERQGGVEGRFFVFRSGTHGFAAGLALGFLGAPGDVDRDGHRHFRVQGNTDFGQAEGLDRMFLDNLGTVDR